MVKKEIGRTTLLSPANRVIGTCSDCNGSVWYLVVGDSGLWCQGCNVFKPFDMEKTAKLTLTRPFRVGDSEALALPLSALQVPHPRPCASAFAVCLPED